MNNKYKKVNKIKNYKNDFNFLLNKKLFKEC